MLKAKNTSLVVVPLDNSRKRFPLNKQNLLEGKRITNIVYRPAGTSPEGLNALDTKNAFLTLMNKEGKSVVEALPVDVLANNSQYPISVEPDSVVWEKSFVEFSDTTGLDATKAVVLIVFFE